MEVSATSGGAFTSMKGDTSQQQQQQQQHNGSDNNNFQGAGQQAAMQQATPATYKQTVIGSQQANHSNSTSYQDEVNVLLDTVLSRIVSELTINQNIADSQSNLNQPIAAASTKQQHSSPSLSPDDATCDLVIDSASNSADNQDFDTQEQPTNLNNLVSSGTSNQQHNSTPTTDTSCGGTVNQLVPTSVVMQTSQPLIQSTNLIPILQTHQHVEDDDDDDDDKIKDIVTLRNLEVTPPPPIPKTQVYTETTRPQATPATRLSQPTTTTINDEQPIQAEISAKKEDHSDDKHQSDTELVDNKEQKTVKQTSKARKRARPTDSTTSGGTLDDSVESTSSSRSKRQRTQTKLFQVGGDVSPSFCDSPATSVASSSKLKSSSSARKTTREKKKPTTEASSATDSIAPATTQTPPTPSPVPKPIAQHTNELQGVIFYEKKDYLAIRNEENSFYLCQLTENVRVTRPMIRVRWLDTKDNKNYFLTALYDHVPQLSILMPVNLTKLKQDHKGEQMFALSNQDRDNIMDRLKRSLNASAINQSSSNTTS